MRTPKTARINPESDDQGVAGDLAGYAGLHRLLAVAAAQLADSTLDPQEALKAKFPNLLAALEKAHADGVPEPTGLRVVAMREGFWRGGIAHSRAPAVHAFEHFTSAEQLEQIFGESLLVVELI
ncbi:hypothetical protein BPNPMPFG_000894 [Mesorhizobium sp. AR07]|uniref:hypothetical protein n=1 Tax=Mesorhizobium sp. AR07 TaxID=2865838 RepID=UPI00215F4396|nr:hypothetical protein [Mesorhizobium sp. AR07]UVK45364.1 hypothetical protein BPNPMPFG_000894 [Mesorhizobium sp. AR07]